MGTFHERQYKNYSRLVFLSTTHNADAECFSSQVNELSIDGFV